MNSKGDISWFTPPAGDAMGYGYAAVETIRALNQKNVRVWFKDYICKVFVSFVQPEFYDGINDQYRIGYTPWESSVLPSTWPEKMRKMDEIWTPCNYNKEIYDTYGVNDIVRVVPHGIDPEVWKITNRYPTDKFIFLHVGSPTKRKGGQRVVDAFLELFGDNDDVFLIMKSNGPTDCRYYDKRKQYKSVREHERIMVIENQLDVYDLAKLFEKANCLVYPTNGEGFGLIPFQGIATGLPTITTNALGTGDFAELSVPLKSTTAPGEGIHLGEWAEPDLNDLREQMMYVYNNYDEVRDKTVNSARIIHNTQTWAHIAQQIVDILGDKIYEKV